MKESKQDKLRMVLKMEVEAAIDNALNKFHLEQINEAYEKRTKNRRYASSTN